MLDQECVRHDGELVVDIFAGGGGTSCGLDEAGWEVSVAINHDEEAILMHEINHPRTIHIRDDVWNVNPHKDLPSGPIGVLWASPSCTHFSKAKGSKTLDNQTRALPWVVVSMAKARRPRVILVENVGEMQTWGPLDDDGRPLPGTKGDTFRQFVWRLETLGYKVEWRELHAHHYGAPTSRKRLFLIARCDGGEIVWPAATHGPGLATYRTAAECIDWHEPCPTIFGRKKDLAEKTLARIAEGLRRFALNGSPYVVNGLLPTLIQTGYGEREGQRPRALDIRAPLGTVVAGGAKHALACAWIVKHYGGVFGHGPERPLGAITTQDHHSLAFAYLTKFYGTSTGQSLTDPMPTVTATGQHLGVVTADAEAVARLVARAGAKRVARLMRRFGHAVAYAADRSPYVPVVVEGVEHAIVDIGMRMLTPRELARAQGFPDSYVLTGTKTSQIGRIGNAVVPALAKVLAEANARRPPGWKPPKRRAS